MNAFDLTDEELESVVGGNGCGYDPCGGQGDPQSGHRHGHGHGHNGGQGGYQGPHINYYNQDIKFSETINLEESTTQYNIW
jgi:hypothetical protein